MNDPRKALAARLRDLAAMEAVYPLAAQAAGLLAHAARPGPLLAVHAILLALARRFDGEAMDDREWRDARAVAAALADYLDGDDAALDTAAVVWRHSASPDVLQ